MSYPNIQRRLAQGVESKGWKQHALDFQAQRDFARRVALALFEYCDAFEELDAYDQEDDEEMACLGAKDAVSRVVACNGVLAALEREAGQVNGGGL